MDKSELQGRATLARRDKLGTDEFSPIDLFSLAYAIDGLTIVLYPMGDHFSGLCMKGKEHSVIAINSGMTYGRQRFSLAHELYHYWHDKDMTYLCLRTFDNKTQVEKDADQFASYLLIPPQALSAQIAKLRANNGQRNLKISDIIRLEQYFQVSHQAMLCRLGSEKIISKSEFEMLQKMGVMDESIRLGYSDQLYRPIPSENGYKTYGSYIALTEKAHEKNLISDGKREELLLDAFRPDLVYRDVCEEDDFLD